MAAKTILVAPGGKEYDFTGVAPHKVKELQVAGWKLKPQPKPPVRSGAASTK